MRQFDVYTNKGKNRLAIPYIVIVQSSYFDKTKRRVVVPLVALDQLSASTSLPVSTINPIFAIQSRQVVLNPLEIVSVPIDALGEKITSLEAEGDTIISALDELFSRAWQ